MNIVQLLHKAGEENCKFFVRLSLFVLSFLVTANLPGKLCFAAGETLADEHIHVIADGSGGLLVEFGDVSQVITLILFEIRYASHYNFVGLPVAGYTKNRAILTGKAAFALARAQDAALAEGYTIKIYDAYAPTKPAVILCAGAKTLATGR